MILGFIVLPWITHAWASANMWELTESGMPVGIVILLGFGIFVLFAGTVGQVQTTVGKVPLFTTVERKTRLRYLVWIGILFVFSGLTWFITELPEEDAISLLGSGFWVYVIGFFICFSSCMELVRIERSSN